MRLERIQGPFPNLPYQSPGLSQPAHAIPGAEKNDPDKERRRYYPGNSRDRKNPDEEKENTDTPAKNPDDPHIIDVTV